MKLTINRVVGVFVTLVILSEVIFCWLERRISHLERQVAWSTENEQISGASQ